MFGKLEKTSESGESASIRSLTDAERPADTKPAPVNPAPAASMTSGEPSVISADLKLIGNVHSAGDVQVDGTIEGDINSRSLTVGAGARIDGSITADRAQNHVLRANFHYLPSPDDRGVVVRSGLNLIDRYTVKVF